MAIGNLRTIKEANYQTFIAQLHDQTDLTSDAEALETWALTNTNFVSPKKIDAMSKMRGNAPPRR